MRKEKNSSFDDNHLYEEANKVVDNLLDKVIEITDSDEEESIEDVKYVNLDENCFEKDESHLMKEYHNKYEHCDYIAVGYRKYGALQLLLKHKESVHGTKSSLAKNCYLCDFEMNDYLLMTRHMRDVPNVITG